MKTILIAPTINEVVALRAVFPKINRKWLDEIVVVDCNSTDGTVEYCEQNGYRVHRQKSRGYGAGIREVLETSDADIVIEFPPDGNSLPEAIPRLIDKIQEGYDFVIASRYKDGAVSIDDDFLTKIGNRIFTLLVDLLFWAEYTDVLVGFRAYRRDAFNKINPTATGLDWSVQLPIQFAKAGLRCADIGADEPARIGGERKMRPFKTGWAILKVIGREFFNRSNVRKAL